MKKSINPSPDKGEDDSSLSDLKSLPHLKNSAETELQAFSQALEIFCLILYEYYCEKQKNENPSKNGLIIDNQTVKKKLTVNLSKQNKAA